MLWTVHEKSVLQVSTNRFWVQVYAQHALVVHTRLVPERFPFRHVYRAPPTRGLQITQKHWCSVRVMLATQEQVVPVALRARQELTRNILEIMRSVRHAVSRLTRLLLLRLQSTHAPHVRCMHLQRVQEAQRLVHAYAREVIMILPSWFKTVCVRGDIYCM